MVGQTRLCSGEATYFWRSILAAVGQGEPVIEIRRRTSLQRRAQLQHLHVNISLVPDSLGTKDSFEVVQHLFLPGWVNRQVEVQLDGTSGSRR